MRVTAEKILNELKALPADELREVWQQIGSAINSQTVDKVSSEKRQQWLAELDSLRERFSTGKTGSTIEEILDDLRAERGE